MHNQRTRNPGARPSSKRKDIPDGIWVKCSACSEIIYNGELSRNLRICPRCGYCFPLEPAERIALLADRGSFLRYDADYDSFKCPDLEVCDRTIITGEITLSGHRLVISVVNICADMAPRVSANATGAGRTHRCVPTIGLLVCEKIIESVAQAADQRLPLLLVYTNSNEAQAQDSTFVPAQTLSISAAMNRLVREKLLYISVLAHSDSHGHFPGFACTADIVIGESNMPGTARVGSQINRSETAQAVQALLQNGMVDMIISRRELKQTLTNILKFFC